jgi:hypothetical protein
MAIWCRSRKATSQPSFAHDSESASQRFLAAGFSLPSGLYSVPAVGLVARLIDGSDY